MVTSKKCNRCDIEKKSSEFHKQNRNTDGLQSICKLCRKILDRKLYACNPQKRLQQMQHRRELIEQLRSYKELNGCKFCPEKNALCLDFHHTKKDKEFTVMSFINRYGVAKIWDEVKKCDVVCSNCHRKLHTKRYL